jgi:hypothetical protein
MNVFTVVILNVLNKIEKIIYNNSYKILNKYENNN